MVNKIKYSGKQFEKDFVRSMPNNVYCYRFKDGGGWGNGTNTRFTPSNICDFLVYNGKLYFFELKKSNGKSIPFNNIKQSQINGLLDASEYGIESKFAIFLNEEFYILDIKDFIEFKNNTDRKSIPIAYLEEYGIHIKKHKLQKYYKFELDEYLGRSNI